MLELSAEQQSAIDRAGPFPAHIREVGSQVVTVLLLAEDFDWVRQTLGDEPEAPRAMDPRTGVAYAVLPEERYERFKAFFEEDPLTPAEKLALLRAAGLRAGWNDPVWDDCFNNTLDLS